MYFFALHLNLFLQACYHYGVLNRVGLLHVGDPHDFLVVIGLDLKPLLLASDHLDVLDGVGLLRLLLHAGDYLVRFPNPLTTGSDIHGSWGT